VHQRGALPAAPPANAFDKIVQLRGDFGVYQSLTLIGKDDRKLAESAGTRPARLNISNSL
jgi:hypothetical protein